MDFDFNEIPIGLDHSQLTDEHKQNFHLCLSRLAPIPWDEKTVHFWYVNRKLCLVVNGKKQMYYGYLDAMHKWRLLLTVEKGERTWHVGVAQWVPNQTMDNASLKQLVRRREQR